jgi:hypothetical protein
MAATTPALRADRLRSVEEGTTRPIPTAPIGAHVDLPEAHAGEGR